MGGGSIKNQSDRTVSLNGRLFVFLVTIFIALSSSTSENVSGVDINKRVNVTCSKLNSIFGKNSSLSTIQKDDLWEKEYKGRMFEWELQFREADFSALATIAVQFNCYPKTASEDTVTIYYPVGLQSEVQKFNKGKTYILGGQLNQYSGVSGFLLSADALDVDSQK